MRRSIPRISRAAEVCSEIPDIEAWKTHIHDQFNLVLRTTSRVEQLEAGHADVKETLDQILTYLRSSHWASRRSPLTNSTLSWREPAGTPDITLEVEDSLRLWLQATTSKKPVEFTFKQLPLPSRESLSKIAKLFGELEEDFDDLPNRIIRCELFEKGLSDFENSLEGDETECLAWCVSLMRDVLDYNNAENFTKTHLGLLKKAIKLISEKGPTCSKEDYKNLHKEFLEAGIALIPTTQKAIDKYGQ